MYVRKEWSFSQDSFVLFYGSPSHSRILNASLSLRKHANFCSNREPSVHTVVTLGRSGGTLRRTGRTTQKDLSRQTGPGRTGDGDDSLLGVPGVTQDREPLVDDGAGGVRCRVLLPEGVLLAHRLLFEGFGKSVFTIQIT